MEQLPPEILEIVLFRCETADINFIKLTSLTWANIAIYFCSRQKTEINSDRDFYSSGVRLHYGFRLNLVKYRNIAIKAAQYGDVTTMRYIAYMKIDYRDEDISLIAAKYNNHEVLQWLIKQGCLLHPKININNGYSISLSYTDHSHFVNECVELASTEFLFLATELVVAAR